MTRQPHVPKDTKVAVLMGGWSTEREVSLTSGQSVITSLKRQGYHITSLDLQRDMQELIDFLKPKPDIVFNALHGLYAEDGRIQSVLDIMEIPYTHSGPRASAIGMHKPTAKLLFEKVGIPCAKGGVYTWEEIQDRHPMHTPYVIKPLDEGSSIGVHIIYKGDAPVNNRFSWPFKEKVMVEEYIAGQELSCAVMGSRALGIVELKPKEGFYDYKSKYTANMTEHILPAPLPVAVHDKIMDYSVRAHQVLECAGISRSDFRYDNKTGKLCILEINTQPGFTHLSIVPEIAAHIGISFDFLVNWLIEDGLCQGLRR